MAVASRRRCRGTSRGCNGRGAGGVEVGPDSGAEEIDELRIDRAVGCGVLAVSVPATPARSAGVEVRADLLVMSRRQGLAQVVLKHSNG